SHSPVSELTESPSCPQQPLPFRTGQLAGRTVFGCDGSYQLPVGGGELAGPNCGGQVVERDAGDRRLLEVEWVGGDVEVGGRDHAGRTVLELSVESPPSPREDS